MNRLAHFIVGESSDKNYNDFPNLLTLKLIKSEDERKFGVLVKKKDLYRIALNEMHAD